MRYFHNPIALVAIFFVFIFAFTSAAEAGQRHSLAYLDPGTGALIFQALIAGILGAGFAAKLFWSNIKGFVLKLLGKEVAGDEEAQQSISEVGTPKEDDEQ